MSALQRLLYGFPQPAPHKRTKPLEVMCLGLPRTGTESLSVALRTLGLQTYHGWDLVFEPDGGKLQHCCELVIRKYAGERDGDVKITAADLDILIGDSQAIADTLPAFFAAEIYAAYPDAKVVLNTRPDQDAWHRSIDKTVVQTIDQNWLMWAMSFFSPEFFWLYELYLTYGYPGIFRSAPGRTTDAIQRNGKWVYREHCNMIRGMVPKENLLEWSVEDGWEPLCKFLNKPIPDEPFPRTNNPGSYSERSDELVKTRFIRFLRNLFLTTATLGGITTAGVMWW